MKKNILLSTGGTGGHILPALSILEHLKENFNLEIVTDKRGVKYFPNDQKFILINTPRLKNLLLLPINLLLVFFLVIKSINVIKRKNIEIVISIGGYMSLPVCLAAKILKKDLYLFEPNLVLGRANRFYLNFAKKIFLYQKDLKNFPERFVDKKIISKPLIRKEFYNVEKNSKKDNVFEITIFGGSQGAIIFDNFIKETLIKIDKKIKLKVNHQTSLENTENLKNYYSANDLNSYVFNYENNFFNLIKNSNLCITRAGASSLAEIATLGIPFLAIPLKNSADDHQMENAKYYEKIGCCWILNQNEMNQKEIDDLLFKIIENEDDYNTKKNNLKQFNENNSWKELNNKLINIFA